MEVKQQKFITEDKLSRLSFKPTEFSPVPSALEPIPEKKEDEKDCQVDLKRLQTLKIKEKSQKTPDQIAIQKLIGEGKRNLSEINSQTKRKFLDKIIEDSHYPVTTVQ